MMLYIQTKQGKLIGPYPEDIADKNQKKLYPDGILVTEMMRKSILRNQEWNRREFRERGL